MKEKNISEEIKSIIADKKNVKGNLIMILHALQDKYGYIPRQASLELSSQLDIPLARIYEVITFYNFFKLEKPGKHTISVCMGTACYLKGAPSIVQEIKNVLHVEEGGTTADGQFQLEIVRCLGCCGLAPVLTVDGKVYGKVKKSDIIDIVAEYAKSN